MSTTLFLRTCSLPGIALWSPRSLEKALQVWAATVATAMTLAAADKGSIFFKLLSAVQLPGLGDQLIAHGL